MNSKQNLLVFAGQPILVRTWKAMCAAIKSLQLIQGEGVRLRWTSNGTVVSFDGDPSKWAHPFKVTLEGNAAAIRPGTLNSVMPTIRGIPLNGDEKKGEDPPKLEWKEVMTDNEGRGWIALDLTLDEKDWQKIKTLEIVQVANLSSVDGKVDDKAPTAGGVKSLPGRRIRHALAMLRVRTTGATEVFQIVYFNLQHRAQENPNTKKSNVARHFFWPQ